MSRGGGQGRLGGCLGRLVVLAVLLAGMRAAVPGWGRLGQWIHAGQPRAGEPPRAAARRIGRRIERPVEAALLVGALVGLAIRGWRHHRARLADAGLAVAAVVVAAAGAEIGLAVFWPQRPENGRLYQHDPILGWSFRPGRTATVVCPLQYRRRIRINADGFRDREFTDLAGARRVAILGDSFTANLGVEAEDVFTVRAERRLAADRVRLMNLGVPGYGQVQELLLLDRVLDRLGPHAVVVVYTGNDFDDNHGAWDFADGYARPRAELTPDGSIRLIGVPPAAAAHHPPAPAVHRVPALPDLYRSTHLYALACRAGLDRWRLGRRRLERLAAHRFRPDLRLARQPLDPADRAVVRLSEGLLDRMARRCRSAGVRFGVVIAPTLWQVYPDRWQWLLHHFDLKPSDYAAEQTDELLAAHCRRRGYPVLDLLPALRRAGRHDRDLYYLADEHWTAAGNRVAAAATAGFVAKVLSGVAHGQDERSSRRAAVVMNPAKGRSTSARP